MRRLLLLRHAKSDWSRPLPDLERPLNPRGRKDAHRLGTWIASRSLPPPDRILASPAQRVRETLDLLLPAAGWEKAPVEWRAHLYLADPDQLLRMIRSLPESWQTVLIAGHNPGLENLLVTLSSTPVPLSRKGKVFTTANLAVLEGPNAWRDWRPHSVRLRQLVRPKELPPVQVAG